MIEILRIRIFDVENKKFIECKKDPQEKFENHQQLEKWRKQLQLDKSRDIQREVEILIDFMIKE